jgi:hypothetical protein
MVLVFCFALWAYHRVRVDNLMAVIRAQRRRMDHLETALVCPGRKGWRQIEPSAN